MMGWECINYPQDVTYNGIVYPADASLPARLEVASESELHDVDVNMSPMVAPRDAASPPGAAQTESRDALLVQMQGMQVDLDNVQR